MPQQHTGENIVQFPQDMVEKCSLPDNVPTFVITENGKNLVSAIAKFRRAGLVCFAHTLQLCINDAKSGKFFPALYSLLTWPSMK